MTETITCEHCGGSGTCGRTHPTCGWHPEVRDNGTTVQVRDGTTCGYCNGHGQIPA